MFEAAEIGNKVAKAAYKKEALRLREAVLKAQHALAGQPRSVIVLIGGVEGAGRSEFANLLLSWLDARGVEVHAFGEPSDEERERPRFWRYWMALPPKGKLGVFLGSWYTEPIINRAFKRIGKGDLEAELDRIVEFETMLSNEGIRLVKIWMHLAKKAQKKRLKDLESDPDTSWRVTKRDWDFFKRYDRFRRISETALLKTSTARAPWQVVEAADERYRNLAAARIVLEALKDGAQTSTPAGGNGGSKAPGPAKALPRPKRVNVLRSLDYSLKLPDKEYEDRLDTLQARLARLSRQLWQGRRSMIIVVEGPDAGGKGGAIRRLTRAMDARNYRVVSTAAPNDEERARPYLWRFWRGLPRLGRVTIYDRSWYGRVLVERLEGFCSEEDWRRAFSEINAFEEQLAGFGVIVVKFWLAISADEQLRRFKDRQKTPYKQYKITEEDWRNRAKWDGYEAAACEMIERTSTPHAPWVLVEANDKRWARVKILRSVVNALDDAL